MQKLDSLAFMEHLHNGFRDPDIYFLLNQCVGHAVVDVLNGDMVINVDSRSPPECKFIRFRRKRPKGRLVQLFE
ncbi:hypothetical protein DFP97_10248 [Paenibacillus prosopidis]|uniref:Uncharacterized protein n=1 Tax=Paenibacillus prosopidis TaxID=630520 RepID=A0A368W720_9BACL|nr:hypothetical protein DFP97_10248 [Paenibacillus prosopidis]